MHGINEAYCCRRCTFLVTVFGTTVSAAKTDEPIEMAVWSRFITSSVNGCYVITLSWYLCKKIRNLQMQALLTLRGFSVPKIIDIN